MKNLFTSKSVFGCFILLFFFVNSISAEKPLPFFENDESSIFSTLEQDETAICCIRKGKTCGIRSRNSRSDNNIPSTGCLVEEQVFSMCGISLEIIQSIIVTAINEYGIICTAEVEIIGVDEEMQVYFYFDENCLNQEDGNDLTITVALETDEGSLSETLTYKGCSDFLSSALAEEYLTTTPNPFTSYFNIEFNLQEQTNVTIYLYNTLGRVEAILARGSYNQGVHTINYKNAFLPSGYYFIRYQDERGKVKTLKALKL